MYCFNFLFYKENTFKNYLGHLKNVQLYTSHWESRYLGPKLSLLKADPQEFQLEFKAFRVGTETTQSCSVRGERSANP